MNALSTLDYAVLVVYLAGTLALGLAIGRRIKTGQDFFLAGRRLPWWAIGMSLVATDIGGTDIIGVGGAAYSFGLAVANFEWIGCVPAMIVAAFVFVPHFWRIGVYTIPEFMERRYNLFVRAALATCWLLFMACNLGVMLYASAKMMTVSLGIQFSPEGPFGFLAGREILMCIVFIALISGLYTIVGGLAAVVYTDAIQCAVMIGGCLLVLAIGVADVGGFGELFERVAAREAATEGVRVSEKTELILPVDTQSPFPWSGILFGLALILSPAYWIGNQAIVQRSLGAKSAFQAQAAYVFGALLKNVIPVVIALPGLVAFAILPELGDGDLAFPTLATKLLPVGVRGIFLAAFIAALMSSVDSYLNAAATLLTHDLVQRFRSAPLDDRSVLRLGRGTTLGLIAWAIAFAVWCSTIEGSGIYTIFQTLMSFFQGPALAILLAGVLWRRANGLGAAAGFVAGIATSVCLFALSQPSVYLALGWQPLFQVSEPFLYFSIWAFVVAASVLALVSFMTEPEPESKVAPLLYRVRRSSE